MSIIPQKVLVVAAHPDDEVLGCGGTIAKHADRGDLVQVLIVAEGATSRSSTRDATLFSQELSSLSESAHKASSILGVTDVQLLGLPDNRLDSIDRLDLIKHIEKFVHGWNPEIVYVHHRGDVNIDHQRLHEAVVTACRPTPDQTVKSLFSYEVPSSTEWQTPGSASHFQPNWFVDISQQLQRKRDSLEAYSSEMRCWPHARSIRAVEHLAFLRGSQIGSEAAEAFMLLRHVHK